MPHQCVRCGTLYVDGSNQLLKGCECGGKFFFFVKQKDLDKAKEISLELTQEEKVQIEEDIKDIMGAEFDEDMPVVLDLENIRILKPGKFELDLVGLFKGDPLVYKTGDGKYVIDIISSFNKKKKK